MSTPPADSAADSVPDVPEGAIPSATTPRPGRLEALDLLRGFALCGILLMNVLTFAWPGGAYTSVAFPYYALDSVGEIPDPEEERKEIAREEKGLSRVEKERRRRAREAEPRQVWPRGEVRSCGVSGPADLCEFVVADLLFDNKMRTLFSMLFGAGVLLLAERPRDGVRPVWLHYRRMLWLLVIGALHGWLLWSGDILFAYAAVGLWLYPLRNLRVRRLLTLAAALFLAPLAIAAVGPNILDWIDARGGRVATHLDALVAAAYAADDRGTAADAEGAAGTPPEDGAEDGIGWLDARFLDGHRAIAAMRRRGNRPELATLDIRKHRGQGWANGVVERFREMIGPQLGVLLLGFLGLGWPMVLGMALSKTGFLGGGWGSAAYGRWAAALYALGLPITWMALMLSLRGGVAIATRLRLLLPLELVGTLLLTLAHAAALLWAWKTGRLGPLARPLAAAGRMALTNYLLQSVICSLLFFGHGLALYGRVPRVGLAAIVACIWAAQLAWSPWWLDRFHLGPAEWAWRSLASWRRLPLRRGAEASPA